MRKRHRRVITHVVDYQISRAEGSQWYVFKDCHPNWLQSQNCVHRTLSRVCRSILIKNVACNSSENMIAQNTSGVATEWAQSGRLPQSFVLSNLFLWHNESANFICYRHISINSRSKQSSTDFVNRIRYVFISNWSFIRNVLFVLAFLKKSVFCNSRRRRTHSEYLDVNAKKKNGYGDERAQFIWLDVVFCVVVSGAPIDISLTNTLKMQMLFSAFLAPQVDVGRF